MSSTCIRSAWALQSLWAAAWLSDVEDRTSARCCSVRSSTDCAGMARTLKRARDHSCRVHCSRTRADLASTLPVASVMNQCGGGWLEYRLQLRDHRRLLSDRIDRPRKRRAQRSAFRVGFPGPVREGVNSRAMAGKGRHYPGAPAEPRQRRAARLDPSLRSPRISRVCEPARSAVFAPASYSFNTATICSSVNLARFIFPAFFRPDSNSFLRKYAVAGNKASAPAPVASTAPHRADPKAGANSGLGNTWIQG
ncbi:hypothetical protein ACVIN2_002925 [Bradyrhizobium sp. USDA 3650]